MPTAEDNSHILAGASVLIVDDEPGMRNFLTKILEPRVRSVSTAASPAEATEVLDTSHFDVVILDNVMPGQSGLAWIESQRRKGFYADTILITAFADLDTVISALRAGVSDFLLKPFRASQILNVLARTLDRKHLRRDNTLLRHELHSGENPRMLGNSDALGAVQVLLNRLAPMDTPVLFTGDSGTGKELAARQLHQLSPRADKPFVAVNCAAISPDNVVAELFGTVAGDNTLKPGLLMLADGGTLLLDEVAQMPETLQTALLRVLEDMRIRPQGGEREIPLNLRFLFATNTDLKTSVAEGRMRADLYHRLNVVDIEMPPLKDRSEDIVELAVHFMDHFSAALGLRALELDAGTLLKMRRYDWPGNIRELRNLIERSVILGSFPKEFSGNASVTGTRAVEDLDLVVQRHILHILDLCDGNRAEAARRLGVSRKTVDRKLVAWADDLEA